MHQVNLWWTCSQAKSGQQPSHFKPEPRSCAPYASFDGMLWPVKGSTQYVFSQTFAFRPSTSGQGWHRTFSGGLLSVGLLERNLHYTHDAEKATG